MTTTGHPLFVLMHGWAYDSGTWDGVRALLPGEDCVVPDAGYFGEPRMAGPLAAAAANGRPLIAVGHSHGTMGLLDLPGVEWAGLVAINGFARFAHHESYPAGIRRRLIDAMVKRFDHEPTVVVNDFRSRCGSPEPAPAIADPGALLSGLLSLRDGDARPQAQALACPKLVLAGAADPIVPADLSRAVAASFGDDTVLVWHEHGGHLLPMLAPAWCVGHLLAFAREIAATP